MLKAYSSPTIGTNFDRDSQGPSKEGRKVISDGPETLEEMMAFYFGEPTNSHENVGTVRHSKW